MVNDVYYFYNIHQRGQMGMFLGNFSKSLFRGWLVLAVFAFIASPHVWGKDFYVDAEKGDNAIADGSQAKPFKHVTVLLKQVKYPIAAGDVIHVASGVYNSVPDKYGLKETFPINLSAGISIIGEVSDRVIFDAGNSTSNVFSIVNCNIQVNISNLTIRHDQYSDYPSYGLYLENHCCPAVINIKGYN